MSPAIRWTRKNVQRLILGRCAHSHCATVLGAKRVPGYKLKHFQPVSVLADVTLSQRLDAELSLGLFRG